MTHRPAAGSGLDLVCGPVGPLPETHQRYRLIAHLGSGGQAEVYRAVRVTGGVSSASVTVKIFRVDPSRPLADELRSWDKGDAVLMDLNNRGVEGICRRSDGFYGPPPHRPDDRPPPGDAVPYQVYEYLDGVNLREYVAERETWRGPRVNGPGALRTLVGILRELHHPRALGVTQVLHMDIKPTNVMVLRETGQVRLIDFTGARYWRPAEITQVAYSAQSGGPEAFDGVRAVSPAYDVHGFGAVACYLVTGAYPRVEAGTVPDGEGVAPPWSVLRHHPMLESAPRLRDHLYAPVADRPGARPSTLELGAWVDRLGELVRAYGVAETGVDWHDPGESRPGSGRVRPARAPLDQARGAVVARLAVAGLAAAPPRVVPAGQRSEAMTYDGSRQGRGQVPARTEVFGGPSAPGPGPGGYGGPVGAPGPGPASGPGGYGGYGGGPGRDGHTAQWPGDPRTQAETARVSLRRDGNTPIRGRAMVPRPRPPRADTGIISEPLQDEPAPFWRAAPNEDPRALTRGIEYSGVGAAVAFVCWGIWAMSSRGALVGPAVTFLTVLVVAAGVFGLCRLVGRMVLVQRLGRIRHTARVSHAITGLFLGAAGIAYLRMTPWVVSAVTWLGDQF